jgi:hypothetical protein
MSRKKHRRNAPCPCGSGKYKYCRYGQGAEDDLGVPPRRQEPECPFATLALFGPDDKTTTKIVAGVFLHDGAQPILKRKSRKAIASAKAVLVRREQRRADRDVAEKARQGEADSFRERWPSATRWRPAWRSPGARTAATPTSRRPSRCWRRTLRRAMTTTPRSTATETGLVSWLSTIGIKHALVYQAELGGPLGVMVDCNDGDWAGYVYVAGEGHELGKHDDPRAAMPPVEKRFGAPA